MFTLFGAVVILFGFVLIYGAPYLPTRKKQSLEALELLNLKKGQTLYELGCGDGRVVRLAAQQGLNVVGYELNPLLAIIAYLNTLKYRKQVKIKWGNFWRADLSQADGIFVFLIDRFMKKLDKKIEKEAKKDVLLLSYGFKIPGKKVARVKDALYLYRY